MRRPARSSSRAPVPSPRTSRRPNNTTANPWYARVVTDDNGQRTIGFSTDQNTKDQSYTIRVQTLNTTTTSKYDTVDITIAKGRVTIKVGDNQSFYLGEEVTLSGTNTGSETHVPLRHRAEPARRRCEPRRPRGRRQR